MRHPTDGTLRRLLDEPAGIPDTDRGHVAGCPACRDGLATAEQDASLARAALDRDVDPDLAGDPDLAADPDLAVDSDLDVAWRRLSATLAGSAQQPAARPTPADAARRRWRRGLHSPVLAAVGVAAVIGGAGAAAAADWFPIFRAEQVGAPTATRAELVVLPEPEDLAAYGDFEVQQEPELREVPDAAAAEEATGLDVPLVAELPRGVTGEPELAVVDQVGARFTFSAEQAAETAAEVGETLPAPPEGLDGNEFRLVAGPGVAAVWSEARGVPAMVVGRAVAPTVYSDGLPFTDAVGYLTSLPGLPEGTASTLAEFAGDGSTLPLPFGTDEVDTRTADVDGAPATVVTSRDGLLAGVVWVEDGVVTAVAGSLSADEVLGVARGLQDR